MTTTGTQWLQWTAEERALLADLWANDDLDARTIAAKIGNGKTRNAVLGQARRMKLPYRVKSGKATPGWAQKRALERGMRQRMNKKAQEGPKLPADRSRLRGKVWLALPGTSPVPLVDLEPGMCKWPIGEDSPYLFCGAKALGYYCDEHSQVLVKGKSTALSPETKPARLDVNQRRIAIEDRHSKTEAVA